LLKIKKEKLSRFQKNMEPIIIGLVTLPFWEKREDLFNQRSSQLAGEVFFLQRRQLCGKMDGMQRLSFVRELHLNFWITILVMILGLDYNCKVNAISEQQQILSCDFSRFRILKIKNKSSYRHYNIFLFHASKVVWWQIIAIF
jgi:hypothetical protein